MQGLDEHKTNILQDNKSNVPKRQYITLTCKSFWVINKIEKGTLGKYQYYEFKLVKGR